MLYKLSFIGVVFFIFSIQTLMHDARSGPFVVLRPLYGGRLILLLLANACNVGLAVYGNMHHDKDFATFLLAVLMSNLILYTFFYIVMKVSFHSLTLLKLRYDYDTITSHTITISFLQALSFWIKKKLKTTGPIIFLQSLALFRKVWLDQNFSTSRHNKNLKKINYIKDVVNNFSALLLCKINVFDIFNVVYFFMSPSRAESTASGHFSVSIFLVK